MNMEKIGLITFCRNNYGSVPQCYATMYFLKRNGYHPVLFEKDSFEEDQPYIEANKEKYPEFMNDFISFVSSLTSNNKILTDKSMSMIDAFVDQELLPEKHPLPDMFRIAETDEYRAFIAGSDQIWNVTLGLVTPFFFLTFAPPRKRIALCPSFGSKSVPSYLREDMRNVLNEYDMLSSREDEGVDIIRDLTGRNAVRLSDPSIFLTPQEWRSFAGISETDERGYLLLHFLNAPNPLAFKTIYSLIQRTGMKVKCFATRHSEFEGIPGIENVDGGPREYVQMIGNAGLVCTDSFHTTMFSLNLNTDFYAFDRQYVHGVSQISRLVTVLTHYGLMDRLILTQEQAANLPPLSILYDHEAMKDEERTHISQYLLDALDRCR